MRKRCSVSTGGVWDEGGDCVVVDVIVMFGSGNVM